MPIFPKIKLMTDYMQRLTILALLTLWSAALFAQSPLQRVEPPNWWAGMHNPELELLLYGDNLAQYKAALSDYKGVKITSTVRVQNPNYLFVNLELAEGVEPGIFQVQLLDGKDVVASYDYELREREPGSALRESFTPADVMYLITPDRFANGNPDNDAVAGMMETPNRDFKGGRHGGDIQGIIDQLDYIDDMGFTAIWLNPVLENDMPDYSYHGYAATDFYKVDQRFGSNEEYLDLIQRAKDKDIKIIMDMILNHCGSEHWFVKDMPTDDWINFGGEYVNTSHRRNTVQDIHASEYDKRMFSDGWFVETMPDLNQRNPLLATYLIQNTIWWIEYSGLSGIRMDTYPYPDKDFMTEWTCALRAEYPNFNTVGEEWVTNPAIVSYWQEGKDNHDDYTSCLPSLMDFPIQFALTQGLVQEEKQYGSGLIELYKMLTQDFLYADPYSLVTFPDNHDMDRFYTQVNEDLGLFKMGVAYILTLRGTPQLYYGTEILMDNEGYPGDHGIIRTDFPGGWAGDEVNGFPGKGLTEDQKEAKAYIKKLLNWRKTSEAIHHGKLMQFVPDGGFYVTFRYTDTSKVMTILNKNEEATPLQLDRFAEMLGGTKQGKDIMTGKAYKTSGTINMPGKSAMILEIE
jgi:glycosidase